MADLTKTENTNDVNTYIENSLKYLRMCNNNNPFIILLGNM